ncbi:MAG: Polyprenyl synthetase [Frankiales bacterium]|nr:Polyprenyl synthetase [Frankiales bacterium]
MLRPRVQAVLDGFLEAQRRSLVAISDDLAGLVDTVAELVSGGKRLRPAFCFWGHLGAGGTDSSGLVEAAAALELFQACALLHDDVMDASDTRRGRPTAHRSYAAEHRSRAWSGEAEAFGAGAAILLGDLCLGWADDLLSGSGFPAPELARGRATFGEMRAEVVAGQYLDLLEQARGGGSVERALRVVHFKAATYTVQRPLHLGGALAGASEALLDAYSAFGLPLGEAFQLRDDLLGVFGDPAVTGKPAGDDLREGKRTVLVAMALEKADDTQQAVVHRHLGDPQLSSQGVADLRQVLVETGAVDRVESLVTERTELALTALAAAPVADVARTPLEQLAVAATTRTV